MTDIATLLLALNRASVRESNFEIAIPGNWSPRLFFQDLHEYPVINEEILKREFISAIKEETPNYLTFFKKTRGEERKNVNEHNQKIWDSFSKEPIMLYFEEIFLLLIKNDKPQDEEEIKSLMLFIDSLSYSGIEKWNEILMNTGACCYQWFAKEPFLYIKLLKRQDNLSFDNYTDSELLEYLGKTLQNFPEPNCISIADSRSKCIEMCKLKK